MAENIRLKDLQNDMKKMLEVVEQICLDGEKREENTAKQLAGLELTLQICMKNKIMVVQAQAKKRCPINHFRLEASS